MCDLSLGEIVRVPFAAVFVLAGVAGCQRPDDDTARVGQTADTVITSHQMQDTTIVVRDTTVSVDTIRREGDRPVRSDTVRGPGAAGGAATGADTAPR
jgi:hypothetical protein